MCLQRKFSFWNIFYFSLILLNFLAMYLTRGQENIKFGDGKELPSNISGGIYFIYFFLIFSFLMFILGIKVTERYGVVYNTLGNSGINGFLDREFFVDNYGTVANAFFLISNYKWEFIPDTSVRPVKVEPTLIKYIYKLD